MDMLVSNIMTGILLTADPSKNLFSEAWTEGNLYSISNVVEKLGGFCCWVISIVGFGIVVFSILKNALSGLYVVNPNFWDKVDEIKTYAVTEGQSALTGATSNGNVAVQKLGSFMSFLLGYIPNVKSLTDFDEGEVPDKKQYFMKSIPLLIAQIFIGMMIFFGFPAKIANWIGSGGTHALEALLLNYDPVTIVTGISDSFIKYELSTDGSTDPWEQNINDMSSEMISIMHTKYDDMQNDVVQQYAYSIEANLINAFDITAAREVIGVTEGYAFSINCNISNTNPGMSAAYQHVENNVYRAQATNGTVSFKYILPVPTIITDSQATTADFQNDFFIWTINASPVSVSNVSTSQFIAIASSPSLTTGYVSNQSAGTSILKVNGVKWGKNADTGNISGGLGKSCVVNFCNSAGESVFSTSANIQTQSVSPVDGDALQLVFSYNDLSKISALSGVSYIDVSLTGGWSTTAKNASNIETSLSVITLRVVQGTGANPLFVNTSWQDSAIATTGKPISEVLKSTDEGAGGTTTSSNITESTPEPVE